MRERPHGRSGRLRLPGRRDATDDTAGEAASAEGSSSNGDDAHVDGTDTAEGSAPRTGIDGLGVIALAPSCSRSQGSSSSPPHAGDRAAGRAADSEGEDLR